jgi:hypothetical protein
VGAAFGNGGTRGLEPTVPRRVDEHLGGRHRTAAKRVFRRCQMTLDGHGVLRVPLVEVGDQHAGVEHDHAGQSSRSCSREPGS